VTIPTGLHEHHTKRRQQITSGRWGIGMMHWRVIDDPRKLSDVVMRGEMSAGTSMPIKWLWDESRDVTAPGYPRLQGGARRITVAGGLDMLEFQFLEITSAETPIGGYSESERSIRYRQYNIIYDIWGVATSATSAGIPVVGDYLDSPVWDVDFGTYTVGTKVRGDGSPDSYFYICNAEHTSTAGREPPNLSYWDRQGLHTICSTVDIDDHSLPGRSLIHSMWTEERGYE